MNRTEFIANLTDSYEDTPSDALIDAAIRKAEGQCGVTVVSVAATDTERYWLDNRAERHLVYQLSRQGAADFNYGSASLVQVHQSFLALLQTLDDEWNDDMKGAAKAKKAVASGSSSGAGFATGPGFRYTSYGRPV